MTAHKKALCVSISLRTMPSEGLEIVTSSKQKNSETRFPVPALVNFLSRVASNLENGRNGQ
jgi:hypothetical protein